MLGAPPLPLLLLLLPAAAPAAADWPLVTPSKCCGARQQLGPDLRCEEAPWRENVSDLLAPLVFVSEQQRPWLARWLPPGGERCNMLMAVVSVLTEPPAPAGRRHPLASNQPWTLRRPLRDAACYSKGGAAAPSPRTLYLDGVFVQRPRADGGFRAAIYCVDGARGPLAPFAALLLTMPFPDDAATKCCPQGRVAAARGTTLLCEDDTGAWRSYDDAPRDLIPDPETPHYSAFEMMRMSAWYNKGPPPAFHMKWVRAGAAADAARLIARPFRVRAFATWLFPCVDLARDARGRLRAVFGYHHLPRRTRAAYLVSRHLVFVAVPLLAAAIAAVACKEGLRASAHGWALCCHAACLLAFDLGQVIYYFAEQSFVQGDSGEYGQPVITTSCAWLAIPMHFFLTASNTWMTAISVNMYLGMRRNHVARGGAGAARRRFAWLSACAWGGALALSGTAAALFLLTRAPVAAPEQPGGAVRRAPWYAPSLAETRTCYTELGDFELYLLPHLRSRKWGAALHFFAPTLALVGVNAAALALTARRVRQLRGGASLLQRAQREGAGRAPTKGARAAQRKGAVVYIKLLLLGGALELAAEAAAWAASVFRSPEAPRSAAEMYTSFVLAAGAAFQLQDHTYAHRAAGHWVDLYRALVALWMAVPEPPDARALWRRLRGGTGRAPRLPPAQRESAL